MLPIQILKKFISLPMVIENDWNDLDDLSSPCCVDLLMKYYMIVAKFSELSADDD
jgi:hypothetical protein